jgi:hypothetical protein
MSIENLKSFGESPPFPLSCGRVGMSQTPLADRQTRPVFHHSIHSIARKGSLNVSCGVGLSGQRGLAQPHC